MADPKPDAFMSQAEFARRRGVSKKTVTEWKQRDLLVMTADGKVDVERSEWSLDQRPASYRGGTTHRPIRGADSNNASHAEAQPKPAAREPEKAPPPRPAPPPTDPDGDGGEGYDPDDPLLDLKQALERKENHLGLLRRLEYLTKKGRLVDRAAAEGAFFDEARAFRDAWISWPGRVAIEMAAELGIDARTLATVLTAHVQNHLTELGEPSELDLGRHRQSSGGVAPGSDPAA